MLKKQNNDNKKNNNLKLDSLVFILFFIQLLSNF